MRKNIITLLLIISLAFDMGTVNAYSGIEKGGNMEQKISIDASNCDGMPLEQEESVIPENLRLNKEENASEDFSTAIPINIGNTINGSITETIDNRLYQFTLADSGSITLDLTSYMKYCSLYIYGSDGTRVWYSEYNEWNENLKYFKDICEVDLTNGTYYLKVTGYKYGNSFSSTGTYMIATKFASAEENCVEPNNDFMEASTIGINGTIKGQIAVNDSYDIYKFSLSQSGRIELTITYYMRYNSLYLYNSMGHEIWHSEYNEWNTNLKYKTNAYDLDLTGDTYYLKVSGYRYGNTYTGNYTFNLKYTNANVNYREPNNDFAEAYELNTDNTLKGQIALDDPYDIMKFSLKRDLDIKITMTSYMKYYTLDLYDNTGERIWYTNWNKWNESVGYRKDTHTMTLSAGNYYLKVTGYSSYTSNASTGTYTLEIGTKASIAETSVSFSEYKTYTGKNIKPSVVVKYKNTKLRKGTDYNLSYENNKSIGTATIVITGKGNYIGTKRVNFYIMPKKASISKVQNTGKGKVTLKWKKDINVTGYEIYRSTQKDYGYIKLKNVSKNKTVNFKDKKLQKGRTYYYKVRAYKRVNRVTYYGAYSKAKPVRIKK